MLCVFTHHWTQRHNALCIPHHWIHHFEPCLWHNVLIVPICLTFTSLDCANMFPVYASLQYCKLLWSEFLWHPTYLRVCFFQCFADIIMNRNRSPRSNRVFRAKAITTTTITVEMVTTETINTTETTMEIINTVPTASLSPKTLPQLNPLNPFNRPKKNQKPLVR